MALAGNTPNFQPVPWLYSPLLTPPFAYPITRNLNMIRADFCGTIDTIGARTKIKKTVLLRTSEYTHLVQAPVMISLEDIRQTPSPEQFNVHYQPVAVLLEGKFESAFRNRIIKAMFPDTSVHVADSGKESAMLVVADGDMIRNEVKPSPQGVMISPLGFDRYTQQTYGNKDFIINAIQYLTGHRGLIHLRSRQLTLRLLDKGKIKADRTKWILINMSVPPLIIILAGLIYTWFRKRKFTRVN
jgi:ABC-2 type transport system permease protein